MVLRSSPTSSLITNIGAAQAEAQHVLLDRDSFATTLVTLVRDRFPEMLGWEEEVDGEKIWHEPWTQDTVWLACQAEFNVELPIFALDKIMAAVVILTSDFFYKHTPTFIRLCNVLADDTFDPTIWDPADSFEMAWAITEAMFLEPDDGEEPFSDDIRRYIGAQLTEDGIVNPPDVLAIGIRDGYQDVLAGYSDDPIMYSAMHSNQGRISEEINGMLLSNLTLLLQQLRGLPLKNGKTKDLVDKISKNLK